MIKPSSIISHAFLVQYNTHNNTKYCDLFLYVFRLLTRNTRDDDVSRLRYNNIIIIIIIYYYYYY
jgi:hypothetical protein